VSRILNFNSVKRGVVAVRRRLVRGRMGNRSASSLSRVIQELEALNRSTERDFLAVGDKLMEFRSSARQIAADMATVAELISGEHGRNASHALTRLWEHSKEIDAGIEQSGRALAGMHDLSTRLGKAFSGLTNMVAVFRSLCTLTQIETARLGGVGADLGHLAAEIRPLSEGIQSSGEGVLEASYRLNQAVRSAMRKGSELRDTQLKEMPTLIAGVIDSLQAFEQRQQLALQASGRQAAEYTAVCEAIDDLVASIQFHDITRQQVEHVVGALRRLHSLWTNRPENEDSSALDTGAILTLQSCQLAEASRLFVQSIERIECALESIAERLQNASEAVRELTGISGDDQGSFFLKMETQFSAVLKMLGTCTATQAEMDSTVAGLAETIGDMRDSVAQIRGTEIQIQRISTNATIRATHLGATGIALNKIAEVMQRLALESNTSTEDAAAALDAMSNASGTPGEAVTHTTTDQVADQMQRALAGLHSSGESSASRVEHVAQLGARLAQDIGTLRGGVSAGQMFAEVAARVRGELEEITAQGAAAYLQDGRVADQQQLEQLATTYTMQRQRDVHESVVGAAATPMTAAPTATKVAAGGSDLGDNVDLF
jgi:hypothetical protein